LGIRHREAIQPPNYKSNKEFLVEEESSDEDGPQLEKIDESQEADINVKLPKLTLPKHFLLTENPKVINLEASDILCKLKTTMGLNIE
jgi:hypothetical protein